LKQKVIVFLPAFNEEESISKVIKKIPKTIEDLDVEILIMDDGSTDKTVEVAKAAGAHHVISSKSNRGLGVTVREGVKNCVILGAEVGVMIDADDEYPADEIPNIVIPILMKEADYTMGSRFLGTINGMKLNRRLGNYFFTLIQSVIIRKWIYDGQSGMRAFSREAMENLEIIHDYNYAQVMTINLVRKGFTVKEIPINYKVRETGTSFIKFVPYIKNVFPAIVKELYKPVKKIK
jgi:glycosyltransferase involved in cell wall biosynthesis